MEKCLIGSIHAITPYNLYQEILLGSVNAMNLCNQFREMFGRLHSYNESI